MDRKLTDEREAAARQAGLALALRDFADDVALAAHSAAAASAGIAAIEDPAVEPWPPMQAPA